MDEDMKLETEESPSTFLLCVTDNSDALSQLITGNGTTFKKLGTEFSQLSLTDNLIQVEVPAKEQETKAPLSQRRNLLQKSKSIGHSLLSQRIARKASLRRNIKLILTPELFRMKCDPLDLTTPPLVLRSQNNVSGSRDFGVTNYTRSEITAQLQEYRRDLLKLTLGSAEHEKNVTTSCSSSITGENAQTPVSGSTSRRRCTPKSLLKKLNLQAIPTAPST